MYTNIDFLQNKCLHPLLISIYILRLVLNTDWIIIAVYRYSDEWNLRMSLYNTDNMYIKFPTINTETRTFMSYSMHEQRPRFILQSIHLMNHY